MSLCSEDPIASTVILPRKRARQDSDNTHNLSPINTEDGYSANSAKRSHLFSWELVESTSPLTPESGIDVNESPCSGYNPSNCAFEGGISAVSNGLAQHQTNAASVIAMDLGSSSRPTDHCDHPFTLRIVDQPEESYRARYDSEGCRGPMKGRTGGCPAVEIDSLGQKWYNGSVQVELVSADGSRLQSCVLDNQNEKNVSKRLQYGEKAQFDNLRIRRLKKQDHTKSHGKGAAFATSTAGKGMKSTNARGKQDEKVAHLLFTATMDTDHGQLQLKAQSESIYLNANHDPPEIHRLVPNYGSSSGGETIAIIGTRMHSPKVSFVVISTDGKEHELVAEIDKEVSHQNALVVRVPTLPLPCTAIQASTSAYVIVTAGKGDRGGKDPLKSSPYQFSYIARGLCKECYQRLPQAPVPPLIAFQGQVRSLGKTHRMISPVIHYPQTSQPAIMTSVITIPQPHSGQTCNYASLPLTSTQPYSPRLTSTNTYATSHLPSPSPSAVISTASRTIDSDGRGEQSVMEILNMLGEDNHDSPCGSPNSNCAPPSTIEPSITEVVSLPSITDPAPMSPEELVRKYLPSGGIEPQGPQSCSSPPACSPNTCEYLQPPATSQSTYLSHHSVSTSQYLAGSNMLPMSVGFPQNQ